MNSERLNPDRPGACCETLIAESGAATAKTSVEDETTVPIGAGSGNSVDGKFFATKALSGLKGGFAHALTAGRGPLFFLLFTLTFAGGLYFALVPNLRGDVFDLMPDALGRWCGENDDLVNFLFFAALTVLAGWVSSGGAPGKPTREACSTSGGLAALLSLVVMLEVAQLWIPGRDSSFRDVLTGWGGALFAWLCLQWTGGRRTNPESKAT